MRRGDRSKEARRISPPLKLLLKSPKLRGSTAPKSAHLHRGREQGAAFAKIYDNCIIITIDCFAAFQYSMQQRYFERTNKLSVSQSPLFQISCKKAKSQEGRIVLVRGGAWTLRQCAKHIRSWSWLQFRPGLQKEKQKNRLLSESGSRKGEAMICFSVVYGPIKMTRRKQRKLSAWAII